MPLLLLLVLVAIGVWAVYCVQDQEPASPRCRGCQKNVGYSFCTRCDGSGRRKIGEGKFVDCTHRFWLISTVVCDPCRQAGLKQILESTCPLTPRFLASSFDRI
jgi:hypothetical protein